MMHHAQVSKPIRFLLLQVTRQLLEQGQFMTALSEVLSLAHPHVWDFIAQVGVLQYEFSLFQMVFVTPPLPDRGPGAGALRQGQDPCRRHQQPLH